MRDATSAHTRADGERIRDARQYPMYLSPLPVVKGQKQGSGWRPKKLDESSHGLLASRTRLVHGGWHEHAHLRHCGYSAANQNDSWPPMWQVRQTGRLPTTRRSGQRSAVQLDAATIQPHDASPIHPVRRPTNSPVVGANSQGRGLGASMRRVPRGTGKIPTCGRGGVGGSERRYGYTAGRRSGGVTHRAVGWGRVYFDFGKMVAGGKAANRVSAPLPPLSIPTPGG